MQISHNVQTAAPHPWMVQALPVQPFTVFPEAGWPYLLRLGFPPLGKLKKPKIISSSKGPLFIEMLDSFPRSPGTG